MFQCLEKENPPRLSAAAGQKAAALKILQLYSLLGFDFSIRILDPRWSLSGIRQRRR
jgi:hypothetical protein